MIYQKDFLKGSYVMSFQSFFNAKIPKVVMLFNQVLSLDGPVRNTGVISDQDMFFSTHSIDIHVRLLSFT